VGPLFHYELVRLARKGHGTLLRCIYVLAVFLALGVVYYSHFPGYSLLIDPFAVPTVPPEDYTRLSEDFVLAVLLTQSIVTLVAGPAYAAGALVEERNRGELDLLFASHLTDREVVLGKLAARSVHLGAILLTGLPVLAMTLVWGGVDVWLLLVAFVVTGLNLVVIAAAGVYCSARARTPADAMTAAYVTAVQLFLIGGMCFAFTPVQLYLTLLRVKSGSGPVWATPWTKPPAGGVEVLDLVLHCVVGNLACILFFTVAAVRLLRPVARPSQNKDAAGRQAASPPKTVAKPMRFFLDPDDAGPRALPAAGRPHPPLGDRPLLWKEAYQGGSEVAWRTDHLFLNNWRTILLLLPLFLPAFLAVRWQIHLNELSIPAYLLEGGRILVVLSAAMWCGTLALRAVDRVCGEREAGTLDVLLMTPTSLRELLGSKWLGAFLYARGQGYVFAALVVLQVVIGFLHPVGAALLLLAVAVHAAFFASAGVWLSLACRRTAAARTAAAVLLLSCVIFAVQCAQTTIPAGKSSVPLPQWIYAADVVNPLASWWYFASFPDDPLGSGGPTRFRFEAATAGIPVFAALAGVLWLDALRRFRRYRVS
jgi:ABC-type transport system involved in multi-copper enzyme maturation permease subunit